MSVEKGLIYLELFARRHWKRYNSLDKMVVEIPDIKLVLEEALDDFPDCPTLDSATLWRNKWLGQILVQKERARHLPRAS